LKYKIKKKLKKTKEEKERENAKKKIITSFHLSYER
jgi:hypothetical protein